MKIGIITQVNQKGQMVIPKDIREKLNISEHSPLHVILRGDGFYVYPISQLLYKVNKENTYVQLLEKTVGAWKNDDWEKTNKKRQLIEKQASNIRKKPW